MPIPRTIRDAAGSWRGSSKLHLSWLPPEKRVEESSSSLQVKLDRNSTYATIEYTWSQEGTEQEGSLLLCADKKRTCITAGWVDSWHQNNAVMLLSGELSDGAIRLDGKYQVEGHPEWGWAIGFELISNSKFIMRMINIDPAGNEEWAVEAVYERS